jgi:hypothetical protein
MSFSRKPTITICRIWEKPRREGGGTFLYGRMGGARIFIVPNDRPDGPDDSPYLMLLGETDLPQQKRSKRHDHSPDHGQAAADAHD